MSKRTRRDLPTIPGRPGRLHKHLVYRTPGISFTPYRIDQIVSRPNPLPVPGELMLWRFRAEWERPSHRRFSQERPTRESKRLARSPSNALQKRYLVSQAFLHNTLSRMLGCPVGEIELKNHADRGPQLVRPSVEPQPIIRIAYAGIWVLLAISHAPLGIRTLLPHVHAGRAESPASADSTQDAEIPPVDRIGEVRDQARRESTLTLLGLEPVANASPKLISHHGAASIAEMPDGQYVHIVDIPMPGQICAAVATHEPLSIIHAFGWRGR